MRDPARPTGDSWQVSANRTGVGRALTESSIMKGVATTSRSGEMGSPQASRRLAPSPDALKKVLRGDEGAHTQCRMIVDERMMIDRLCGDASGQRGRNSPRERRVLVEREMRARVQVVREVVAEHWRQPRRVGGVGVSIDGRRRAGRSAMISSCSEARQRTMNERVEQREEERQHGWTLSKNAPNLNQRNGYRVFDWHR